MVDYNLSSADRAALRNARHRISLGGAVLLLGICLPLFFQLKSLEVTHTAEAMAALAGKKGPPEVWLGKKLSLTIAATGFLAGLAIMISGLRAESRAAKRARDSQKPGP